MAQKKRSKPVPRRRTPQKPTKPSFEIKVLDHMALCGPGTSTRGMFLVRETEPDRPTLTHQVFVDKHGMYCAHHGVDCPAVVEVDKANKKLKVYS